MLGFRFEPPSLSPQRHVMDVSFFLPHGKEEVPFSEVADIIRATADDCGACFRRVRVCVPSRLATLSTCAISHATANG